METGALDGLVADQKREIKARWKFARRGLGSDLERGLMVLAELLDAPIGTSNTLS